MQSPLLCLSGFKFMRRCGLSHAANLAACYSLPQSLPDDSTSSRLSRVEITLELGVRMLKPCYIGERTSSNQLSIDPLPSFEAHGAISGLSQNETFRPNTNVFF